MKIFTLLLCFIAAQIHAEQETGETQVFDIFRDLRQIIAGDAYESDIHLYIFQREKHANPLELSLFSSPNDWSKPIKFIIHGWLESSMAAWYSEMKDELLKYDDVIVIEVGWQRIASSLYSNSAKNTQFVGEFLGRFIAKNKIPLKNIHLIGHSLGAHVAGFTAKYVRLYTGKKIHRISGLDPAGPYFDGPKITELGRLDKRDAHIVDVIHTDAGFYGYEEPLGTLDIYVNGGKRRQPGCTDGAISLDTEKLVQNVLCSHVRSYRYFIQSINNANIMCRKCASYGSFKEDNCNGDDFFMIVHQNITKNMKGICTVNTGSEPPYFFNKF